MIHIPRKPQWKHQVKSIEAFHLFQMVNEKDWSIRKTSKMLNRSLGGVSEDLRLSHALRIYPEVNDISTRIDAMDYLARRGRCKSYPCGDWKVEEIQEIITNLKQELEVEDQGNAQHT